MPALRGQGNADDADSQYTVTHGAFRERSVGDGGHTPGPWGIGIETDDESAQVIAADGQHLAVVSMYPVIANAALIAAAPELLAACREAEKIIRQLLGSKSIRESFHERNVLENTIKAAIRKAENRD